MNVGGLPDAMLRSRDRRNERGLNQRATAEQAMVDREPDDSSFLGFSGGPAAGRDALGRAFLAALASDFARDGKSAIEMLRKERPHDYVKLIAALLPKEFDRPDSGLKDMTDDELARALDAVRCAIAAKSPLEDQGGGAAAAEVGGL